MGVAEILAKKKLELANKNKVEGELFINEYAKLPNTIKLESGIAYEILKDSQGQKPTLSQTVECHYHGTNLKGEVFDSSVNRNNTATFSLNKVIKGWQEILPLMSVGSKWKVVIPSEYAYGEEQLTKEIGPNSTLIFEIELISIK